MKLASCLREPVPFVKVEPGRVARIRRRGDKTVYLILIPDLRLVIEETPDQPVPFDRIFYLVGTVYFPDKRAGVIIKSLEELIDLFDLIYEMFIPRAGIIDKDLG